MCLFMVYLIMLSVAQFIQHCSEGIRQLEYPVTIVMGWMAGIRFSAGVRDFVLSTESSLVSIE